jgi:lipopolysaccharide transport system ATP-binding protein
MYVRLAFAVAAHLEPEILLVDEVLAVGDIEFQQKCLGKMRDVASHGRTVLFVSHNLGSIRRLCGRAVLLEKGRLVADGAPAEVISAYLDETMPTQAPGRATVEASVTRNGTGVARLREVMLSGDDGEPLPALHLGERFRISAVFEASEEIRDAVVEFGISAFAGDRILTIQTSDREGPYLYFPPGRSEISAELDVSMLPGDYVIDVAIHHSTGITADHVEDALRFTALNAARTGGDHYPWNVVRGYVRPDAEWSPVRQAAPRPAAVSARGSA